MSLAGRRSGLVGRVVAAALLATAALAPAACTPLPPARKVTDMSLIAGEWQGQIAFARGPYQLFYLTINPDGTLVARWGGNWRWGNVTLEERYTRFSFYIWSGNLDYLEGAGDRVLLLKEDFFQWDAIVRPLR